MTTSSSSKAPGTLDPDFGESGQARFPIGLDRARSKLLPDGRILTVGAELHGTVVLLFRHLDNGVHDTTYGTQGVARVFLPDNIFPIGPVGLLVLADGGAIIHVTVGSLMQRHAFVFRIGADGVVDPAFGDSGFCRIHLDQKPATTVVSMVMLEDGKLMLNVASQGSDTDVYLMRLDNGQLDPTFGDGTGMRHVGQDYMPDLLALPGGGLLFGGTSWDYSKLLFWKFLADGSPDTDFGENGVATVVIAQGRTDVDKMTVQPEVESGVATAPLKQSQADLYRMVLQPDGENGGATAPLKQGQADLYRMVLQPDGKIVAVGGANVGFGIHTLTLRLTADGSLDPAFNGGEPKIMVVQGYSSHNYNVALQADGRIVTAGFAKDASEKNDFLLMRMLPSAAMDASFGGNGQVMTEFGGSDACEQVEVQPDGKILASGRSVQNPQATPYILARYLG